MKRKNWKRTAAFVTSMTMATTMMPVELASVIVNAAANESAEIVKLDWSATKYDNSAKSYIKSLKVNGSVQTNLIYSDDMKIPAGSNVEIISKVPLNIDFNATNEFTLCFKDFKTELGITYTAAEGDTPAKFVKNDKEVSKESVLAEMLAYAGYSIDDKTFTAQWKDLDAVDPNVYPYVEVKFAAIETVNNGQYTYKFTMPDDNNKGTSDKVLVSTSKSEIKVNFYESEEARTKDKQAGTDNGVWNKAENKDKCNEYFNGTVIEASNDNDVVDGNGQPVNVKESRTYKDNEGIAAPYSVIVGDTVTITAANPFVAHVSDGNNEHSWINATNSFEKDEYKSVFTMPKYDGPDGNAENIIIDIVKVNENYTYKLNGDTLLADADTGSFANAEAAKIIAKYYDMPMTGEGANAKVDTAKKNEIIEKFGTENEVEGGKEINGAVPNGKLVVVKARRALRITAEDQGINKPFKVTKNGSTVYETNLADGDAANNVTAFGTDGTAGTYNAVYTVKGNNDKTYDLSYSFRIAAKDELTAADVSLTLSAKENNNPVDQELLANGYPNANPAVPAIMAPGETIKTAGTIKDGEVVTFMLAKGQAENIAVSNNSKYQFTVTPAIADLMKDTGLDPAKCYVDGVTSGSTLGKEYQFIIHVTDPEFGGSDTKPKDIKIKWKVVSYDEIPHWSNNRFDISGEDLAMYGKIIPDAQISIDELADIKDVLADAAQANEAAKAKMKTDEVTYQWIKAPGANRTREKQDELDKWEDDLPSELGDYTVYIIYDDEVQATVDVSISLYSVGIYADDADLTYKYGHKFELTKPTVQKDAKGEVVDVEIENLTCKVYNAVEKIDEAGTKTWVKDDNNPIPIKAGAIDVVGQLNAGTYIITFTGKSLDEKYTVKEVEQVLTVSKKKLDDPSLVILIDPFAYDGTTKDVVKDRSDNNNKSNFTVRDMDFEEGDPRYNISDLFKITEGGKQSAIGAHDCTFTLVSEVEENSLGKPADRTKLLSNFDGKTKNSEWHITAERANETGGYDANHNPRNKGYNDNKVTIDAGLKWNDENTTLYDNGRIHLEITRNADDKIRSDKKTAKIEKFGVIIDKEGKIVAPKNYDPKAYTAPEIQAVEKFLQFGNGFTEGGYTKTSSPVTCASQTYKVNIEVKDVETGVWARPYVLYEDGTVSYGDVRYLDLTNEAINRLKLWTAPVSAGEKAVRKADLDKYQTANETLIKSNVQSGYNTAENKFYVYSRYVDLKTAGFTNVAEVADFGIVADRDGEFDAAIEEVAVAAYDAAIADGKNVADATEIANAAVKEYMTKNLKKETAKVVGHYDKKNKVLGVNEYAASIKLGNAATGCWVRSYIDLGNGLVIYNDPMYIESASEYYGNAVAGTFRTKWEKKKIGGTENAPVYDYYNRLVFEHTNSAEDRIAAFAAKAGVDAKNVEVVKTGVVADKENKLVKTNKMILGAGFLNGVHKDSYDKAYSAKLTPNGSNNVSVRTYTIFKIKGAEKDVEVTVYGDVKTYKYSDSENSKRVVEKIGNPDTQIASDLG